jgi:dipeptidase E
MKLYLSSYYLGNDPARLAELVGVNKKVGIIMNATDEYGSEKRPAYLAKEVATLKELGLDAEELDLRNYFSGPSDLSNKLESYGLLWVMGGNSFVLRRAMKLSGFDILINNLVAAESLVYGGFSAGSVVAGPSLHGIELVDDPHQLPEGYDEEVVWEGLGLVDFSIAPHYKSDHPESPQIENVVSYFEKVHMAYKAIHDGQAIVVDGDHIEIVG